jgi:molecular chaperone GrpE
MIQGPDNDRPEPYVSPRNPAVDPARPASGAAPGAGAGQAAQGAVPGTQSSGTGQAAGKAAGPTVGPGGMPPGGPSADAGHPPAPGPDGAEIAALRAELEAAEARASGLHEQYLRAVAETENVRRRSQEDVAKARKYAIESFAESLLPVVDSLEMALKVDAPTVESVREGVEATLRLLVSAFEKNRLVGIDPAGEKFDPNLHQAISTVPAGSTQPPTPANHVASVLQKGYLINDRVLRPALVTVAQA